MVIFSSKTVTAQRSFCRHSNLMRDIVLFVCVLAGAMLPMASASADVSAKQVQRSHPNLTVTQKDISALKGEIDSIELASDELGRMRVRVDALLNKTMDVPIPKDAGGGYTHEQHKRNYQAMYDAALMFQITADSNYLSYARKMLLEYAELYPTIGIHPKRKEQSPGRIFWQSLNEAVWLVYSIQAYDMVVASLTSAERQKIETQLLRPMADFLSAGQPETFNKIHNHGTWAAAAVGMTGYVLDDETLVKQALYGLDMTGEAGFLQQIEQLFSPDGYYAEGPYYQRYALMPFVLFAKAIEVNQPELKIFEQRDQVLLKAIRTTVQLSYNKLFFGINDAIKDKGIETSELVHGIAIAYEITEDPTLLPVARRQNNTLLTGYGFKVAKALQENLDQPFQYRSMQLRDGKEGDQGALAIFRNGIEYGHQALVMKNTSQGLGHGHFDKLHWLYFDNGNEIVSDYGAARFLNIEAKYGGHYLPENNAWAKQTVAHNTVVVDEQSHFEGDWRVAQKSAPEVAFFTANDEIKITSASISDAYPDSNLIRTMAMVNDESLEHPLVIDVFKVNSAKKHQYDLPLHYQGHIISHTVALQANSKKVEPLGEDNGYQFLWDRGRGVMENSNTQVTWLNSGRFYTLSMLGGDNQQLIFTQLGANDPNFNLRNESSLIRRVKSAKEHTFVSVLETHGEYNGTAEYTLNAKSSLVDLSHQSNDDGSIDLVTIGLADGKTLHLAVAYEGDESTAHSLQHDGQLLEWTGHYALLNDGD